MTPHLTDIEVAATQEPTKGPWYWRKMGNHLSLVAAHSGTLIVMDFVRKGMNGAEPRFAIRRDSMGGLMVNSSQLCEMLDIDHPDARLISLAPEMLDAIRAYKLLDDRHANCPECEGEDAPELCPTCFPFADDARLKMRAVLTKVDAPNVPDATAARK